MKTPSQKQVGKLITTRKQWEEIRRNEMAYSSDLRKHDVVEQANMMIAKVQSRIDALL